MENKQSMRIGKVCTKYTRITQMMNAGLALTGGTPLFSNSCIISILFELFVFRPEHRDIDESTNQPRARAM